jgi:uncharacterized membrane protein
MKKERFELYSDAILAIITTIMVLEIRAPEGVEWSDLAKMWPVFLSYSVSYTNLSITWYIHHHILHDVRKINSHIIIANFNLLFTASLIPFATSWLGLHNFAAVPLATYCFIMALVAAAGLRFRSLVVKSHGEELNLIKITGSKRQFQTSILCYLLSIPLALLGYKTVVLVIILYNSVMYIYSIFYCIINKIH